MSQKGHYEKVRRPTDLEVYQDARRILEELLTRQIDENPQKYPRYKRNKTDPTGEAQNVVNNEPLSPGTRSKTMPSKYRASKEEKLKEKELDHLKEIEKKRAIINGDGSVSSADTDGNQSPVSDKRKKKSLFKRAKERLIHTFHRDQKEGGLDKVLEKQSHSSSPNKRRRQKKTKSGQVISEKHRHIHAHVDEDKTAVDYTEEREYQGKGGPVHTEVHSVTRGKGSIFSSFRRIKKDPKDRHSTLSQSNGSSPVVTPQGNRKRQESDRDSSLAALGDGAKGSSGPPKYPAHSTNRNEGSHHNGSVAPRTIPSGNETQSFGPLPSSDGRSARPPPPSPAKEPLPPPPPPPPPLSDSGSPPRPHPPTGPAKPPSSRSKSSSPSSKSLNVDSSWNGRAGVSGVSSSSSNLPVSDHTSDNGINSILQQSLGSNVLDSPGEDIQFMDSDNTWSDDDQLPVDKNWPENPVQPNVRNEHASMIKKFHDSKGLLDFSWLADRSAENAEQLEMDVDETVVSKQRPDGNFEVTTTVTATRTVVLPDVPEEPGFDVIDGILEQLPEPAEPTPEQKEAKYAQIAQKLIEMGDHYSQSMSDQESSHIAAAQPTPLTDLEKEIIECLRSSGDRNSKQLDESVEVMTQGAKQDAYQRFRSTIQNSLGHELNWHQIAFLFYTTKGVVSAVGRGSKIAADAKDFTLKYTTETFASWIMDQGGFDSMLSSSESDYELD